MVVRNGELVRTVGVYLWGVRCLVQVPATDHICWLIPVWVVSSSIIHILRHHLKTRPYHFLLHLQQLHRTSSFLCGWLFLTSYEIPHLYGTIGVIILLQESATGSCPEQLNLINTFIPRFLNIKLYLFLSLDLSCGLLSCDFLASILYASHLLHSCCFTHLILDLLTKV